MSWNVRGLGKLEKMGRIRKLIYERKVDIVLLQETKKVSISENEVRALWGKRNMDFMVVGSDGSAEALLCIWNPDVFRMVDCCCNKRFILISSKLLNTFDCSILNVYAPNKVSSRCQFWDTLLKLKSEFPKPWCLGEYLNEIRNIGERVGCSRRDKGMIDLNPFLKSCELNDLLLLGKKFTWCNAQDGEKWSRIDRFFLNLEWLLKFNFKEWGVPRFFSDHCPILLMDDERDWEPKPFRFINAWSSHPSFPSSVVKLCLESRIIGKAGYVLFQKLKMLKVELKKWNFEVFGNLVTNLKKAEKELVNLDILAENRVLVIVEKARRREVRGEVWKLTSNRRSRNSINSITVEGEVIEEPAKVRYRVLQHFKRLYSESWARRLALEGVCKSVQDSSVYHDLEAVFSEAKVRAAVKEYFRPTSLVGSLYKILSKVLALRLKRVLLSVIGETQFAFLGGKGVLDGVFIANEIVDGWKKNPEEKVLLSNLILRKRMYRYNKVVYFSEWLTYRGIFTTERSQTRMPCGVVREIEKLEAFFLWGGNGLKRKVHLVKWTDVSKSLNQDVLAIANHNQPLVEFFLGKYQIKAGNGSKIKFWYDKWVGEKAKVNRLVAVLLVAPLLGLDKEDCPVWNGSNGDRFKVSDIYRFSKPFSPNL
ncbi:uncharacterized protein LOC114281087 [Camellia sinensis]|uniref:uncharacterized protein LOC114281087 n=1 Tax=Camellia sinensis TaxID=4442 RepID=UPI001036BEE4|nr:uncharacterized protein LOC114281087 [Camellia sinensis]